MRIATIDLGTNTFLLLIADVNKNSIKPVHQEEEVVRLGRGMDNSGDLSEEGMEKGLACLRRYVTTAKAFGVEKILAAGTSALRQAKNRQAFTRVVQEKLNVDVKVISGETEAEYSYFGALSNKPSLQSPLVMIDIGGGSTELCWGNHEQMLGRMSINIGSVRLTERFLRSDPVRHEEVQTFQQHIQSHWKNIAGQIPNWQDFTFIGVAGTVTTLAAMENKIEPYDSNLIDASLLRMSSIRSWIDKLASQTIAERKKIIGLSPKRADVILAGALILESLMQCLGKDDLIVSDRGLRFGMALAEFQ